MGGAEAGDRWRSERAGAALLVHALIWVLGTPGLDFLSTLDLEKPERRAAIEADVGDFAQVAFAVDALNRHLREPLVDLTTPLQRPFRISQEWNLYRDGPERYVILEVWVDGALRFRTADPEHAWLAPQLRNRHVRPVVESTANQKDAPNWRGLTRYVVERARAEDPGAQEVELRSRGGPFPGRELKLKHRIVAKAPDWKPEVQ